MGHEARHEEVHVTVTPSSSRYGPPWVDNIKGGFSGRAEPRDTGGEI